MLLICQLKGERDRNSTHPIRPQTHDPTMSPGPYQRGADPPPGEFVNPIKLFC